MSRCMTKPTKWRAPSIHPVWSESSSCAEWIAKDPSFLYADSEDSDQTGWMPRLIWVLAGCTVILLVLSWDGSVIETGVSDVEMGSNTELCYIQTKVVSGTDLDKVVFDHNRRIIFVSSPWKHLLWVLIRITSAHNIHFYGEISKISLNYHQIPFLPVPQVLWNCVIKRSKCFWNWYSQRRI